MAGASTGAGTTKSPIKILANIFISFIGAGVLGLPYAFKEAGIIEGIVIMTAVGILSVKAMLLIIECKYMLTTKSGTVGNGHVSPLKEENENLLNEVEQNGKVPGVKVLNIDDPANPAAPGHRDLNYGDVGYHAIGHVGRILVEASILISQIGFCCAYLIFISENLSDYIPGLRLGHWLGILLPPLALLCLLRHLSSLAISSLFAQVSNLMAFAVVFWFDFEHISKVERRIHPKKISLQGFPFFLAVSIYCYEGAGMILSLESSLAEEVRSKFKRYFIFTLSLVTVLYISFGACGYLSFGPETNPIITLNLPSGASFDFAIIVKSCLCLALFFTYPVMMYPVINILEKKVLKNPDSVWQGNLLRVSMVALTGLVVVAIPSFSNLMALVGSTCCTMLAFTLPGVFHIQLAKKYKRSLSRWAYAFDIFLIVLGVVGALVGTWDALGRLKDTHTDAIKVMITQPPFKPHVNHTSLSSMLTTLTTTVPKPGIVPTHVAVLNGTV